ncbi:YidH family protein [Chitinophaga japonensis]
MAFGFVVVKFSLFVKQLSIIVDDKNPIRQKGFSPTMGILLIASGIVTVLFAYIRYLQVAKNINSEAYQHTGKLPAVFTAFVMACGLFLVVYLLMTS